MNTLSLSVTEAKSSHQQKSKGIEARPHRVNLATAIILVNYGDYAQRYLEACYASLMKSDLHNVSIYIVDNQGNADSEALISKLAPQSTVLHSKTNLGWAGGNNLGIKIALANACENVILLNMDTVVDPAWLEELMKAADENKDIHLLQSTLLLESLNHKQRINSVGNQIHYLGYGYCEGYGNSISASHDYFEGDVRQIGFASGSAVLIKREVFETIGFFRDDYFMYYEDLDFSWRARIAGFGIACSKHSLVTHRYHFDHRMQWLFYYERNRLYSLFTNLEVTTLLLIAPCLLVTQIMSSFYFLCRQGDASSMRAVLCFLKPETWRKIRLWRSQNRAIRKLKDGEIFHLFSCQIVFTELNSRFFKYVGNPFLKYYGLIIKRLVHHEKK